MFFASKKKSELPSPDQALPGRSTAVAIPELHFVNGNPMDGPLPEGHHEIFVGMGCFWGAERCFWQLPGVYVTAVGYIAGITPNPSYEEVCTGRTGHNEGVRIVYNSKTLPLTELLKTFWENHDPTQGMAQGNDIGTQYRSGVYCTTPEQRSIAGETKTRYQIALDKSGRGNISTEILTADRFYFAEDYHQQYLAKNPGGYCGLGGTGITMPREAI